MTALRGPEQIFNLPSAMELQMRKMPAGFEGTGVALALGGGFSRGFAHLGVLQVLEQERIPVSAIVGTSIGALLGAAFADGISLRDLCDLGRRVRVRDFLRFHHPEQGVQRKDRIGQFVREWFRAKAVEELRIPTAIVTTDLDTGAPYVFATGPLEVAIRASCAFPGLVKPVEHEGRLLADGCITAPVPTAIAARINGGCVLGVSVGSNAANSFSTENVVKVFDPAFRASHRSALEPSWSRHADILLEPQVHHIDWNDFSRVDEAFAAGAEAARRALPALRELLSRRSRLAPAPGISFLPERGLAL
jgi:NTE family protein